MTDEDDGALHIELLGELAVRRGRERVALPASRRTRALLGYLVAEGTPHSRTALCDLLWDGTDDPRASLRWSLTKLRPLLDGTGATRLVADREHVAFAGLGCRLDTQALQPLAESAGALAAAPVEALEAAAQALRGEFLDGLELPGCYRYHHWCMAQRERYGALRRAVLQALVERLVDDPERALPYGRAMVDAEPLAEAGHATLVRLLAAAGRYPDAERHHEWARELLQREVAAPAGGPLDQAIHRVRRERREAAAAAPSLPVSPVSVPASAATASPSKSPVPTAAGGAPVGAAPARAPALQGRDAEQAAMAALLARRGPAPLLLFTGEPGIGKTRLLDLFASDAAAAGHLVIRGRCFEAEMVRPYGLWLDALRGLAAPGGGEQGAQEWLESLPADVRAQAAPLLAGRAAEAGDRERLFEAAAALLRAAAARQPLALALDDLQWIDEGSAALLHYLVRTLEAPAIVRLAGAARAGEVDDNPPARALLQSLAREGRLQVLRPAPLTADEAARLVRAAVGAEGHAAATKAGGAGLDADVAWRQSGGNPLYLLELARATQHGHSGSESGGGSGSGIDGVDSLGELITARLASLDAATRDLLAWAAASAREVQPEVVAQVAGLTVPEVLASLERLEHRALIVSAGAGHFDFAHGLVRQALYRGLSQARRRAVHRQYMRALLATAADDPALQGEIAHHAEQAGEPLIAARAGLAAGEFCLRVFANAQAAERAERGLALVEQLPPGAPRVQLEIGLLRLRVAAAAGAGGRRLPALAERIEAAIAAAEAMGLHAEAASGWEILAFWRQRASDVGATQEATLAAARMTQRADARTRCLQLANTARCLLDIEAEPERGRTLLEAASALAGELDLTVMEVEFARGLVARADGDLDAAAGWLTRAVRLARGAENPWRQFECLVWLATVDYERQRHAEVRRHVEEIVLAAARMGEPQAPFARALAALSGWREARSKVAGSADVGEGTLGALGAVAAAGHEAAQAATTAEAELQPQLEALRALDDKAHLAYALNEAADLALAAGRRDDAARWAAEALAAAQAVRRPTEVAVARARLVAAGRPVEAVASAAASSVEAGAPATPRLTARAAAAAAATTPAPTPAA